VSAVGGQDHAGTGTIPIYGYTGREPDETGLVYYRARYYDPTIGRFTQRDPIGLQGGINPYVYVNGNPVNFIDPQGLQAANVANTNNNTQQASYYGGSNTTQASAGLNAGAQSLSTQSTSNQYADNTKYSDTGNDSSPPGVTGTPGSIVIAARSHEGEGGWGNPGYQGGAGYITEYKCNIFVNQVTQDAGAIPPLVNGRPANAGELANSSIVIPSWAVVSGPARNGDILAVPEQGIGYTGHSGIVVGQGQTASANSITGTITINDWGFRNNQTPTIRRYTGVN
jgi:RHS repeat-associated protein